MSDSEIRTPKSEMGKRSRRMVVWTIAVPIVILLLAQAAAKALENLRRDTVPEVF